MMAVTPPGEGGQRVAGDSDEAHQAEVRHFIERFAMVLAALGMPPMPSRVWVASMVAEGETVTSGEIGERLGVSPAAISGAVKYLLQVGLLERVAVPGSRRQHFRADANQWAKTFVARRRGMEELSALAGDGAALVGPATLPGSRLAELGDFFDYIASEIPRLVESWLERTRTAR
jgi:hypothetical protein